MSFHDQVTKLAGELKIRLEEKYGEGSTTISLSPSLPLFGIRTPIAASTTVTCEVEGVGTDRYVIDLSQDGVACYTTIY